MYTTGPLAGFLSRFYHCVTVTWPLIQRAEKLELRREPALTEYGSLAHWLPGTSLALRYAEAPMPNAALRGHTAGPDSVQSRKSTNAHADRQTRSSGYQANAPLAPQYQSLHPARAVEHLTARKLPKACQMRICATLGQKHFPLRITNNSHGNLNPFFHSASARTVLKILVIKVLIKVRPQKRALLP